MSLYQISFTHEDLGENDRGEKPHFQEFVHLNPKDAKWIGAFLGKLEQRGSISDVCLSTTLRPRPIDVDDVREMFTSVFPTGRKERG
jgi:hypothetical protein